MNSFGTTNNAGVAIIPNGTVINGNIVIEGKLNMYGMINGNIDSDSRVNVSGDITGNIRARDFYAKDSFIVGQIECAQGATVRENTVILGDIKAETLVVDGAIQGNIDIKEGVVVGNTAIIDSDIKARSIQVSNGAAINGHCSLCYADVNLADYFPLTEETEEKEAEVPVAEVPAAEAAEPKKPKAVAKPKAVKKSDSE